MAQIFVSYSKQNIDFARHFRGLLQQAGFEVWMDEIRLSTSQQWAESIESNISGCSIFMIILSPESKESQWVARELLLAERLRKPIFPILYSGDVWWNLANIQYEDMRSGMKAALSPRLTESLQLVLSGKLQIDTTPMHLPEVQTDSRRLEAAMPAETQPTHETEVWAKVSLPASEGLRAELPAAVPSGDVIQKGDTRGTTFPIRFPVDPKNGRRTPVQAELRVMSGDFVIAAPGESAEVEIPPETDSRTVIFTLQPKVGGKTSGRARVFIDLIYEMKIVAQISVSTQFVERVTAVVPRWNLMSAYAAHSELTAANDAVRGVPAALYEVPIEEGEPLETAPDDEIDDSIPLSEYQYAAPIVEEPRHAARRTAGVLRIASAAAALLLVFAVVLFVSTSNRANLTFSPATQTLSAGEAADRTQIAILIKDTPIPPLSVSAQSGTLRDLAVAPLAECAGTPGTNLVNLLRGEGFDVETVAANVPDQQTARGVQGFRIVAWGGCSAAVLTLKLELIETDPPQGIADPLMIRLQVPTDALDQSDSYGVRLVRAVTAYARGDDGASLTQTFADLAASAVSADVRAALETLQSNSAYR